MADNLASVARAFADGRTRAQMLFAVACVGLADWLFYGHPVGWTLGAFGAVSGAGIAWLGEARGRTLPSVLLGACFLALCLRAVFDPDPPVIFLGLAAWVAFTLTLRGGWSWSLTCWLSRGALFFWGLIKAYVIAAGVLTLLPLAPPLALLKVRRLRAWLIPLLFGLVFLGLFALANPVLSRALKSVGKGFEWLCDQLPAFVSLPRLFLWLSLGAWLWTLLRHTSREGEGSVARPVPPPLPTCGRVLTPEVIRNALVVFNALFAFQTISDLWYLWGGGALPQGMTYAEYAHRGAYPLVVTALLAAGFVLATFREGAAATELRVARGLVYAWLLQNVFLVASAGWRLGLYVSVFSLSRLRLAAGVWMFLVACGLVWIFARIFARRPNLWLIKANVVTALTVLTASGLWTPNMFIAEFNVRHCRETGHPTAQPIDLRYLSRLGYDALPAWVKLERLTQGTPLAKQARVRIDRLSRSLNDHLSDWRGLTPKRCYLRRYLERKYRPEPVAVEATARQSTP